MSLYAYACLCITACVLNIDTRRKVEHGLVPRTDSCVKSFALSNRNAVGCAMLVESGRIKKLCKNKFVIRQELKCFWLEGYCETDRIFTFTNVCGKLFRRRHVKLFSFMQV